MSGDILIFGAGSIGRGLFGELAAVAGRPIAFVEAEAGLAERLRRAGSYEVRLVGRTESRTRVAGYRVLEPCDGNALDEAVRTCAFAATAVGGPHLAGVAPALARGVRGRRSVLNVLVCENLPHADRVLVDAMRAAGAGKGTVACVPCCVERMVRPEPESLELVGEGGQSLFLDASAWSGAPPDLPGLLSCRDLAPHYARKLFTNNAGHAVLAYEGHLDGCERLCDALDRPRIRTRLEALLDPAADMLAREFALDRRALAEHVTDLIEQRFANRALADPVRRVARQPLRKLGAEERLVGLLRRLQRHGLPIAPVCRTIAAAMHYRDPADAEAVRLGEMLSAGGPERVLREVCAIQPGDESFRFCRDAWRAIHSETYQT